METQAKVSFEENWLTINYLKSFREGRSSTTHQQIAALNQAGLVFCITAWEAYVENLLNEAVEHLADGVESFQNLPKSVSKAIVDAVTPMKGLDSKTLSGRRPQHLVGDGWRTVMKELARTATAGSNFNTPNSKNVRRLFQTWCGLDVTESWSWQKFAAPAAANRLDESIVVRGQIVHTGVKPDGLNKNWIVTYGENNIRRLVEKTDIAVMEHVAEISGRTAEEIWEKPQKSPRD